MIQHDHTMKLNKKLFLSSLAFLFISSNQSIAAGYSTGLYSTSGMGNSYAGSVTGVHDISDMFFNPSILSNIKNNEFIISASHLDLDFDVDGASGSFAGGSNATGKEIQDAGIDDQVPALYLATPINDKTTFGLSITSPFGLSTKYDKGWVGRYRAIESSIATFNINPSLSYKINDKLSVGAGLQAQYYKAALTKAVYTGGADAIGKVHGSDWGYGYNLGANYKINDQLKFGIGYRSKIDYKITGTSRVADLSLYSDINAKTTTPESLTAGTSFKLNEAVELAYDVTWTRWSRLKSLIINATQNSSLNDRADFNWHDSFLHSVGANFSVNNQWLVRTGVAYEKDAVTNANRELRAPNSDKVWTSIGFNYKIGKNLSVDGTYLHQFIRTGTVNLTDSSSTVNSVSGKYKSKVDVFSIALKKQF